MYSDADFRHQQDTIEIVAVAAGIKDRSQNNTLTDLDVSPGINWAACEWQRWPRRILFFVAAAASTLRRPDISLVPFGSTQFAGSHEQECGQRECNASVGESLVDAVLGHKLTCQLGGEMGA